jgi:hypothetical protein
MPQILVGINVELPDNMPVYTPDHGYTQRAAHCCGRLVWIGPKQQKFMEEHSDALLACALCCLPAHKELEVSTMDQLEKP